MDSLNFPFNKNTTKQTAFLLLIFACNFRNLYIAVTLYNIYLAQETRQILSTDFLWSYNFHLHHLFPLRLFAFSILCPYFRYHFYNSVKHEVNPNPLLLKHTALFATGNPDKNV